MKSSNILDSEKDSVFEGEHNEFINKDNEIFERITYMPTLPSTFNSLVEKTVKIETEEPRYVIELLGDLLGIKDYQTNKAAFWFLDIIALQVLRYKNCLDDYYRSILISWLVGEMTLIRDEKLSREDFFKKMRILFLYAAEKLPSNDRLLHWELLMDAYSEIMSQNSTTNASANSEKEYLSTNKLSKKELITEDAKYVSQKNKFSFIERDLTNYNNGNSVTNDLLALPKNSLTTKNSQTDTSTDANVIIGSSSLTNPNDVLDVIVEATYSMYANELRYALIYAVFVKPIQIQIFQIPYALRISRQIKLPDPKGSFDIQLREQLEKVAHEIISNGKKLKEKKTTDFTKKEQIIKDVDMEITPTPPPSLSEEEMLTNNRQFILPLIEANEAAQIYEMHARKT